MRGSGTHLLAYPIFSEYIPLRKNRARVVTETHSSPRAKYRCTCTSTSGPYISGSIHRSSHVYGTERKFVCRRTSESRNAIMSSS